MEIRLKYIGSRIVDLVPNVVYEAVKTVDTLLGNCFSIKDESGEWYLYDEEYVAKNFEIIN